MNKITSVCVYSASSTKIDPVFFNAARELGTLLGQRHIRFVNGAGNMGLMAAVAMYVFPVTASPFFSAATTS